MKIDLHIVLIANALFTVPSSDWLQTVTLCAIAICDIMCHNNLGSTIMKTLRFWPQSCSACGL